MVPLQGWSHRSAYLSLDEWDGSNGLLQSFDLCRRAGEQGRPRVHNGLAAPLTQTELAAHRHPAPQTHSITMFVL